MPLACQKNGGDQAWGRSRGGWSTKIHAATIDENCTVALHLTPGQAHDGIEPVIPPISTRSQKLPCDKERYRGRNRIERFFNRLKRFRRLATRYDKLAKTFFAALHLVAAFLIIRAG
jgi:transposase